MGKNYIDKKLLDRVQKKYELAKKSGYSNSTFWKNEKAKLEKLVGKKAQKGKAIAGTSRLNKTTAELVNRELNIIAKSKIASKYGYEQARKKQRQSLVNHGYVKNLQDAKRFQKILGSDIMKTVIDNLSYIGYKDALSMSEDKSITVKKIEKAYDKVNEIIAQYEKEHSSDDNLSTRTMSEYQKGELFLNLLKKG